LFQALFYSRVLELGAAITQAKLYLLANAPTGQYDDLIDTYLLLGDPALHVPLAEPQEKKLFLPLLMRGYTK
jgi:hypothetical protein